MSDDEIEIETKSDRELLIIAVQKLNNMTKWQSKADKTIYGNGWPGLTFRFWALCVAFLILASDSPKAQVVIEKISRLF